MPHTMVSAGLFVRMDSPIRSTDDIKGKEIIVQKGDVIDDYLREKGITSRIVEVKDPADVLRLLASGRHDCGPYALQVPGGVSQTGRSGSPMSGQLAPNLPQLRYCFAVRRGNSALLSTASTRG